MRNNAVLVDFNLEIPDVESSLNRSTATAISSSVTNLTSANGNMDKIIGEVASSASTLPAKKRRKTDTGDSLKRREVNIYFITKFNFIRTEFKDIF